MAELLKDPRFADIPKNPKFRGMPKNERKIKIDKRFSSMLKNKEFRVVYTVDKRGRPVNQSSSENLRKYYDLSSEDDTDDDDDDDDDNNDGDNEIDDQVESDNSTKNKKLSKKKESVKADKKIKVVEKKKVSKNEKINNKKIKKKTCVKKDETDSSETEIDDIDNDVLGENVDYETNNSSATDDDANDSNVEKPEVIKNKIDKKKENMKNTNAKLKSKVSEKLKDLSVDYARGKGVLLSSSSSEEESSEEEEEDIDHNWGELDKDAEQVDEPTERLALCNMDWDKIRAVDLMVLFTSFLPPGGLVRSVTIYPTEFGLERMKEEDIKGPIEITEAKRIKDNNLNNETDENDQDSNNQMEKIRQYQLNRLKYYVAVIVFDSKSSAEKIYTALDGIEYESTATKIDLRVITDDKVFNQEPKEVCDKYPDVSKYKPRNFITTALQQVNVKSTWDENNMGRQEFIKKINSGQLDEISNDLISTYVKLSSSDDDDLDNENFDNSNDEIKFKNDKKQSRIDRFRSLLKEMEENDNKKEEDEYEIECTWGLNLKEKSEKLVEEKMNNKDELAPFDKYLLKRKEKKKSKIQEKKKKLGNVSDSEDSIPSDIDMNDPYFKNEIMKIKSNKTNNKKSKKTSTLCNDDNDDDKDKQDNAELELLLLDKEDEKLKNHFDMNKIEENEASSKSKKKRLRKKKTEVNKNNCQDNFTVNVDDPRFVAIYSSHDYNIDPTDPHYRKTKGTEALVKEKLKRRVKNDNTIEEAPTKRPKDNKTLNVDVEALVNRVKYNTKNMSKNKKK
ncbi:ESF1 homolog [Microplitis mediator]|uniref:ESF1 homolog n=1 Tax=Microplitis mediator TaxID=375433 RepID=UPI0025543E2F|nr:ESF1 homolog [Microplitis mediator]